MVVFFIAFPSHHYSQKFSNGRGCHFELIVGGYKDPGEANDFRALAVSGTVGKGAWVWGCGDTSWTKWSTGGALCSRLVPDDPFLKKMLGDARHRL
jgi:hypothetical protein